MEAIQPWLDAFHTRIFGAIHDNRRARQLSIEQADLHTLTTGTQFTMREGNHWLRFWTPGMD
jgi:hypothetical protein